MKGMISHIWPFIPFFNISKACWFIKNGVIVILCNTNAGIRK